MAKAVKLLVAGICPLVIGYLLSFLMYLPISAIMLFLISLLFIVLWGYAAFCLADANRNIVVQSFLMCAFGLFMLVLVLYQELVLGQYWSNSVGVGTQMYFLPFLSITSTLFSPVLASLGGVINVWSLYSLEWIMMFIICLIGCAIRKRNIK